MLTDVIWQKRGKYGYFNGLSQSRSSYAKNIKMKSEMKMK